MKVVICPNCGIPIYASKCYHCNYKPKTEMDILEKDANIFLLFCLIGVIIFLIFIYLGVI